VIAAVAVYSTTTDPNCTVSITLCACVGFAVGVTVHATLDVLVPIVVCVVGDTVSTDAGPGGTNGRLARPVVTCFAPTGKSVAVYELSKSVHVSVASRPSVTTVPPVTPTSPLLLTTHVASAGNTYIAVWGTVAVTVVFVSLNVNVNVVLLFGAVTVAPSFFVPVANAASSTTVGRESAESVESTDTVIEPTPSDERSTLGFVFENVKLVSVSRSATSEYPSSIGATVTAFGTAYTANDDADGAGGVFSSSV
jgi:hypothetical protein